MAASTAGRKRGLGQGDATAASMSKRRKRGHTSGEVFDATWQDRSGRTEYPSRMHPPPRAGASRQQEVGARSDADDGSLLTLVGATSISELHQEGLVDIRAGFKSNRDLLLRLSGIHLPAVDNATRSPSPSPFDEFDHLDTQRSFHDAPASSPSSSAPLRLSRSFAHAPLTPSPTHSASTTQDPAKHLTERILADARLLQSAAEEAQYAFSRAQRAYDRMSLDLALLGHDAGGAQSATINDYAQKVSAFSRFADLHAAGVERTLMYGADSVPQVQLEELRPQRR